MYDKGGPENLHKFGKIEIKLSDLLEQKGVSRNMLRYLAEMQRSYVNRYYNNNDVALINVRTLAKLCYALECSVDDILVFIPPEND